MLVHYNQVTESSSFCYYYCVCTNTHLLIFFNVVSFLCLQTSDILYYEVLDIPLPELQGLKNLKVAFHHATKDEVSAWLINVYGLFFFIFKNETDLFFLFFFVSMF